MHDLNSDQGLLQPILQRVRLDESLMLAIRDNYINIYYRGGNLLRVKEQTNGTYTSFFDEKYRKHIKLPSATIKSTAEATAWVDAFPYLKEAIDLFLSIHNKPEREFQQVVARENNFSTISNDSEYFISDIEFADSVLSARFDMLAIRWLASERKNGSNCRPALIEMKYGDGALAGKSGLLEHLQDMHKLISDKNKYEALLQTITSQFEQLADLGLLNFKRCKKETKIELVAATKPEVIFVLANHNPRSTTLASILKTLANDPEKIAKYAECFDLRFFVSHFAGYGLHSDCMLTLSQFQKLLCAQKANEGGGQ
jgi:hypothetical protein